MGALSICLNAGVLLTGVCRKTSGLVGTCQAQLGLGSVGTRLSWDWPSWDRRGDIGPNQLCDQLFSAERVALAP
jgi:hypothetical protein